MYRGSELSDAVLAPFGDALLHPDSMTQRIINLKEVAPTLLAHLRDHL